MPFEKIAHSVAGHLPSLMLEGVVVVEGERGRRGHPVFQREESFEGRQGYHQMFRIGAGVVFLERVGSHGPPRRFLQPGG